MQNTQLYVEVINYANKRYNAGVMLDCLIFNQIEDGEEAAFVGVNKKQAQALEKSFKTIMRKNNYTPERNDEHVYSDAFETAIAVKEAEVELATLNITKQ